MSASNREPESQPFESDSVDYSPSELKSIFIAALDYEPREPREKFLLEACGANTELRRRVESLLAARERADDLLGADAPSESEIPSANPYDYPLKRIDRYRIERLLGQGGFGQVYLAFDEQLNRRVAIKLPHRQLVARDDAAEAYLTEARAVAGLNHPHIVPVYDVGSTDEFPCYIVSKYIDGIDLATRLKQSRLSILESVEFVATVAEALHHAHQQGLVHRDIKPGNLLLDHDGIPFLADFGVALREENVGTGPRYAGTPTYMSPEQARGEGHRVDGRSDLFSLGVVFYELLVGKRPFSGKSTYELMEHITSFEPRPPRQSDDRIPKELDRICLKALSKRASERYSTAKDMADELRQFLKEVEGGGWRVAGEEGDARPQRTPHTALLSSPNTLHPSPSTHLSPPSPSFPTTHHTPHTTPKIVPKGLRSFDSHDADFFLELLPGPRDRDGLPESIRFWKARIEETEADNTFSVGLIYGPSGCGKSSLVKAGLLPRLSNHVITVYLEATAEETEIRLLNGLRNRCPALSDNLSLKETLAALRHGRGIPVGKKVLIVLDQFEQWLHAKKEDEHSELVESLRQCDGRRVQCIVMVRDDFWMAATRFMRELEIRLLEAQNSAAVDLFPIRHAEKVLAAFGQAFGAFPDGSARENKEAKEFLKHAVSGLAQEGKVICVRLALFSEMMKGKAWTKVGLKEVGGTEGIGVTFLEETFSATTALPERRRHQHAVRSVLKELLPELGTDIKGHSHSYAELLEESGYTNRPEDFNNLLRILDSELRLITPTDPEGVEGEGWRVAGKDEDSRSSSLPLIPPPSSRHAPPSTRHAPPSTSSSTHHPSGAVHVSSELSAVGSVAVRHGAGGEMLSGDEIVSQRGVVRPDEPNPSGGGVGPGEHRRGTGEGAHQGVPEPFEHRPGIADGSGNTFDAQSTSGIARTVGTGKPAGPDGSNQPHAQRPEKVATAETGVSVAGGGWRVEGGEKIGAGGGWRVEGKNEDSHSSSPSLNQPPPTHHAPPSSPPPSTHQAPPSSPATGQPSRSTRSYQLTHDYLVPSLRDWLTRKQKETRRGRAELLLADRSAVWNARPENRQLPSILQWFNIRWLTPKKNWTPLQKKMMAKGARVHAMRGTIAALLLMGLGLAGVSVRRTVLEERSRNEARIQKKENTTRAEGLVASLLSADSVQVPAIISDLKAYREWADPLLKAKLAEATDGSAERLVAALALLPIDDSQIDYLKKQLPVCDLEQFPVVRKALLPYKVSLIEGLWGVLEDDQTDSSQKFQASASLAEYSPDDERWQQMAPFVAQYLTNVVPSVTLGQWRQLFLPGNTQLTGPLIAIHADRTRTETQRENAAFVLSDFLKDQPAKLCDVILVADELREYAPLIETLKSHAATMMQPLLTEMRAAMPVHLAVSNDKFPESDQPRRDAHWKRQSLAAVTLVHLGYPDELWSLLKFSPDPSLRSFIINHLGKLGTNHNTLAARLEIETDVSIRRALIQSLGGLDSSRIPSSEYKRIAGQLQRLYVHDSDSGIHSSASWALRKWGAALAELPTGESVLTERRIAAEQDAAWKDVRRWYVNGQGQTMVVIPTDALVGQNKITTGFAISNLEVTVADFRRFRAKHGVDPFAAPAVDCPVHAIIWFDAAEYCNWLSQQEGIPEDQWVYLPNEEGKYANGMKFKEQWSELQGYRMPTIDEWIFACRSGTSGTYHFGEPVPLLKHYGWYATNSFGRSYAVGSLLPNEYGIFDMHGNLAECTQNPASGPWSPVNVNVGRAYYGGSFFNQPLYVRSEHHQFFAPTFLIFNIGIRLARTLPLKPHSSLPPAP